MYILTQFIIAFGFIFAIIWKFKRYYVWWEWILQLVIPIVLSMIVYKIGTYIKETDTEYWSSTCVKVLYQERYETYDRESYDCNCSTDKEGRRSCQTCYRWVCNSHGPYYKAYDQFGNSESIPEQQYYKIKEKFHTETKTGTKGSRSCLIGSTYESRWDKTRQRYQIFVREVSYKNKVRYNRIYNPYSSEELKEKSKMMGDYPQVVGIEQNHIVGPWPDPTDRKNAEDSLTIFNGLQGPKSRENHGQIKVFFFLYKNLPQTVAELQRAKLQNGNKNEFIVVMGYDGNRKMTWYDIITYCENPAATNRVKEYLYSKSFSSNVSLTEIVTQVTNILKVTWVRREFTPLNQYINVEPPAWIWIVSLLMGLILGTALLYFFKNNEFISYDYISNFRRNSQ